MTIEEYIKNLERLKQLAVDRFGNLTPIERRVINGSFEWLVDNLNIKRGEIQLDADLTKSMNDFVEAVNGILNSNKTYRSKLNEFLSDLKLIQKNTASFHITTNKFNINTAGVNNVQKTVVAEIIDQYQGNGLNAHFAEPLRDLMYRNMLGGMNMREAKQVLTNYILSGKDGSGKLGQYLLQTAQQGVDSYTGMINQELKKEFTFTGYAIAGSLILTSSKQCVYAVEHADNTGYLDFEEWEKILEIARQNPKARLIAGTNLDNLPINKLHWGCRHDFIPTIKTKKDVSKK